MKDEDTRASVRRRYAEIARRGNTARSGCCGPAGPQHIMSDDYIGLQGYDPEADLGLGCGLPTEIARIRPGDVVIDLGSGAGNDCFVARSATGPTGRVIGIDFTPEMIRRAGENALKLSYTNVEFRQGDITDLPVPEATADVVVSNCVLNLEPDKNRVFEEIYRVLKPGGHFSISDIVLTGALPEALRNAAEAFAGCVAGAILKDAYLELAGNNGFTEVAVRKEKVIPVPDKVLAEHLDERQIRDYRTGASSICSITVFARKPLH
ncbi:MAG TPA: arsenite methyltransferase [Sphingobacteriaceae bacterium]